MKTKLLFLFLALLAAPWLQAADICITSAPNICHTTSADENTAGVYFRDVYDDRLCAEEGLSAGCTPAQYAAAGGTATFYDRNGEGAKHFFMDQVIKLALTNYVSAYNTEWDKRAKDLWSSTLTTEQKQAACTSWGKTADCR